MTRVAGHGARRSLGVGLALFGLVFQLFLPISLAAAGPGGANHVLEICTADGLVRIPLPANETKTGGDGAAGHVEACNHCVLHAVNFFVPTQIEGIADRSIAAGIRLALHVTDDNRNAAANAGFDARGPPRSCPIQGKT